MLLGSHPIHVSTSISMFHSIALPFSTVCNPLLIIPVSRSAFSIDYQQINLNNKPVNLAQKINCFDCLKN